MHDVYYTLTRSRDANKSIFISHQRKERSKELQKNETMLKQKILIAKQPSLRWSGLQRRMTITYALTTLTAVLVIETLIISTIWVLVGYGPLADDQFIPRARQTASIYALAAAVQANGEVLNTQTTFEQGQ